MYPVELWIKYYSMIDWYMYAIICCNEHEYNIMSIWWAPNEKKNAVNFKY